MNIYLSKTRTPRGTSRGDAPTSEPLAKLVRPAPVVGRYRLRWRSRRSGGAIAIAISQRDETVLIDQVQARRLARALLRASHA